MSSINFSYSITFLIFACHISVKMSGPVQRIEPFTRQCDFVIWLKKFEMILKIAKIDNNEKVDFLLTNLDLPIFESVLTAFPSGHDYSQIVNFLTERYSTQDKFLNRLEFVQINFSGTFDEYASRLQALYENFDNREEMLIAKFVCTIPKHLATELRIRRPSTLTECVKICNSLNSLKTPLSTSILSNQSKSKGKGQPSNFRSKNVSDKRNCYRCGSSNHLASDSRCPALRVTCNFCKKVGHFAAHCLSSKNQNSIPERTSHDKSVKDKRNLNVRTIDICKQVDKDFDKSLHVNRLERIEKPHIEITVNGDNDNFSQRFMVDSGSDVCVMPLKLYRKHFVREVCPLSDDETLHNYDKSEVTCVEGFLSDVFCTYSGRSAFLDFVIRDVDDDNDTVLGTPAIAKLALSVTGQHDRIVTCSIARTPTHDFSNRPTDVVSDIEPLPKLEGYVFYILLEPDAPASIIQKPRRVPFSLESQIETEISKLIKNDIIEEIDSSPYLSPVVVVPKSDNSIRLCVDYKKINKHIVVDQHPLPTADEIFAKLAGAQYFSKLDLRAAYHQLEIREDSRNLTAFTTHVGQFRYKRLPFGLANAPSAYMKVISNILRNCTNTTSYLDDILIFGKDLDEHDRCLKDTLQKLMDHGITLNESKCQYRQRSIQFLGRCLSPAGISPLPATVEAIKNAPVPHDKSSVRSFMGLTNFYRNFIPDAADISPRLCDLLKDGSKFEWTDTHQSEFDLVKKRLAECVPLAFYDPNPETKTYLTTDASGLGISAYLSQVNSAGEEKPVYFLSRKLSSNECAYSVSEKEFLAVLWGAERLHQYLYGRPFTVRTDHQCLKQLLMNGVDGGSAPCRVIRWATKLLQYNFDVQYIPGKENKVADALSRVPMNSRDSNIELFTLSLNLNKNEPITIDELKCETSSDNTLTVLKDCILKGWPSRISLLPECIRPFWNVRHELSVVNDILFRGDRYVIPDSLTERIVLFAHEGHMGITKCKARIRELYWWPYINDQVERKLKDCICCHETARESPVQVSNIVTKPWHQVAVDIKGPIYDANNRPCYIFVLVDCFTKFIFTKVVQNTTSVKLIEFMESIFAIFGHCTVFTSDNGPQFTSWDFTEFLRKKGIIHRRSAIYNPQSNGVVERVNRNIAKLLDVSIFTNIRDLQSILNNYALNYNRTSHSTTGKSPCELMFTFIPKCDLDIVQKHPITSDSNELHKLIASRSQKNADYANERRRPRFVNPYRVDDFIVTKKGQIRKLIGQVGPFSFKMNNGFTINTRFIARKAHSHEIQDLNEDTFTGNYVPITSNLSSPESHIMVNTDIPVSPVRSTDSDVSDNVLRRSNRNRRRPSYLQDYVRT